MDVSRSHRRRPRSLPRVESLDHRDVPATFGIPWGDPNHLTLSFAPDGTSIAGEPSTLFQSLDAQMPTATWQGQILRAFQTWASQAGINLTVVADDGSPFGAPGLTQHDPRFGDIRIGAHAMAGDALAISVPSDPSMTGTWTGDLLINTADLFDAAHLDLFSVVLHEAGHDLGLSESPDAKSPMYTSYAGNSALTSGDIKNIQALYGTRPADANEGSSGNDTIGKAASLQAPGSYDGQTPLVAFGDIASAADTDVFALRPPLSNSQGGATVRLQTAGVSLLAPHLVVVDTRGTILGEAVGSGTTGSTLTVHLDRVSPSSTYYLKVSGATSDAFGFGHYGLAVSFDGTSTTPAPAVDAVLRQDGQGLAPNDIAALFRNPSSLLYNDDRHSDDTLGAATVLSPSPGFAQQNHYQTAGSLSNAADVDYYRIKAVRSASGPTNVLTVRLRAISPNGVVPRATIFDSDGTPLPTTILANGPGQFVVQAVGFKGGGNLTIRVAGAATTGSGNYGLDADFGGTPAALATFTSGSLSATAATAETPLYIARSQLFQFLLAADPPAGTTLPAGTGVRLTIVDEAGRVVLDQFAAAGDVVSAPSTLLTPGSYRVRFAVVAPDGIAVPSLGFRLLGEAISDPIGPAIQNPTLTPVFTNPTKPGTYIYPNAVVSPIPYWMATISA